MFAFTECVLQGRKNQDDLAPHQVGGGCLGSGESWYVFACLLLDLFCLKGRVRERVIFLLLVYSPDGCSSLGWVRLKPGAKNFVSVFLMGSGA